MDRNGHRARSARFSRQFERFGGIAPAFRDAVAIFAITLIALALSQTRAFANLDGLAFDTAAQFDSARPPRVIVVEVDPAAANPAPLLAAAKRAGVVSVGVLDPRLAQETCHASDPILPLFIRGSRDAPPASQRFACRLSPAIDAPADDGMYRRQFAAVEGPDGPRTLFETKLAGRGDASGAYVIRMPASQNIPRVTAVQLTAGIFAPDQLNGYVALFAPPSDASAALATTLDPQGFRTSEAVWRAYAVQTLIDRREVRSAPAILTLFVIVLAALAGRALFGTAIARRHFIAACIAAAAVAAILWFVLLQATDTFAPLTASIFALLVAGITKLRSEERRKDRALERTIEKAINLAFGRSVLLDASDLPTYFQRAAALLQLPYARMAVRASGTSAWEEVFATGEADGAARTIRLDDAEKDIRLTYSPPRDATGAAATRILDDAIARVLAGREWQSRLLAGRRRASIDRRLRSAANLISVHSDELARGLDALDTAVCVFRPLGMPIYANVEMRALLTAARIDPDNTALLDIMVATTELGEARARSMIREVLLQGGDLRIPMRDFGGRQRILRLGIATQVRHRSQTVLVVEAVDITELDRLSELRLAFGTFIDRQLRNDLEAITLGSGLARDPRLEPAARARILDRIGDVVARARGRLDEVRGLLEEKPYAGKDTSFPIESRKIVAQALDRAQPFADESGARIASALPDISGFSIAEPLMLSDMVEAMLRIVIADTAQGGEVVLQLEETDRATSIRIAGGFGLPFDRFVAALDAGSGEVPSEYQIAAAGMAEAMKWRGGVTYWSAPGAGFRFAIQLRRV